MPALPIYLDNHATTRVDPRVLAAMLPYFSEKFGNAASVNHRFGWEAAEAVATAREQAANLLNCSARELVFTSGATEANNLALKGVLWKSAPGSHFIINAAEHRAILDPARKLQREGYQVTILPVDKYGRVDPQQVADAIGPNTVLVSVMAANNEVGTYNHISELADICLKRNVLFHCDAAQVVGRIPVDLKFTPIDLLSVSAHKLYGPKGIGALFVRREPKRIALEPLHDGGGHEGRLRSGTLPVPLIVGFGAACEIAIAELSEEIVRLTKLRERLWKGLSGQLTGLTLNGAPDPQMRLPGNLNVSIENVNGESLMHGLTEIAVSSGSACTSADTEPSHVLRAMGISEELSKASVRFGVGRFNTVEEIDHAIGHVVDVVTRLLQSQ